MVDFSALIQRIEAAVYENGVQAITGQILQDCLKDVVNTINVQKQDGIYHITVTVDGTTGTPSGTARMDDETNTLELSFSGLKGETGPQGPRGLQGVKGDTGPAAEVNEEDIDFDSADKLQFADRVYNSSTPDGLGYVILRKNKTFAQQVTDTNTIYEIRYDFDLDSGTVTIPSGCVLRFVGGSLSNGTLTGDPFRVVANNDESILKAITFDTGCHISNETIFVDWFDFVTDGTTDNHDAFKRLEALVNDKGGGRVVFGHVKTYAVKTTLSHITNNYRRDETCALRLKSCPVLDIDLNGSTIQQIASNTATSVILQIDDCANAKVHDGTIIGDRANHDYTSYTDYQGDPSTAFEWNYGICQYGGFLELYNLGVSYCVGDGIIVGSGKVSSSVSYSGQYHIHDCEVSYCGRNGITCHSALGVNQIERCHIHHIGVYDSMTAYNPMAGIDMEFEDGIGNIPYMSVKDMVIEECTRRAISVSTNTYFNGFVLEDCSFRNAALVIGNTDASASYCQPVMRGCYIEDNDDSTQTVYAHTLGPVLSVESCTFVGLRLMSSWPKRFVDCSISTTDSLETTSTAFPYGGGVVFPVLRGTIINVNSGFTQIYGQDDIRDSRIVVLDTCGEVRIASATFTSCRLSIGNVGRTSANIGTGDIVYNDCDITWGISGNYGIAGYSPAQNSHFNGCRLTNTSIKSYGGVVHANNSSFTGCVIQKVAKSGVSKDIYSNCDFYNCSGTGTGVALFSECSIISDAAVSKSAVLGLANIYSSWDEYVFSKCYIEASNFTSNTSDTYATYHGCHLNIANAYLTHAALYNCVVESTTANRATTFVNSVYLLSGVVTPATSGATADRPTASDVGAGFTYFDTDLGKMIVSNGTDWVNMDGTAL